MGEVVAQRKSVRLGKHGDAYLFEASLGLHEEVMGLAVLGSPPDPEVMFVEHGTGEVCRYLELHPGARLNPDLGPKAALSEEHRAHLLKRTQSDDPATKFHAVASAFALEDADLVNAMLDSIQDGLIADGGGVWIVQATHRLQRRKAMFRVLHSAQAQPTRPLEQLANEPQPLDDHSPGGDTFVKHFFDPVVLLPSPWALGFTASRAVPEASETYLLLLAFGPGHGVQLWEPEVGWDDVFGPTSLFRQIRLAGPSSLFDLNQGAGDFVPDQLFDWWTDCLNHLLTEATDLGRFRGADGIFDARNAFRELRTLDRIFVNCARIQLWVGDHIGRVAAAFEFFDLLPGILDVEVEDQRRLWRSLTHPDRASEILRAAFTETPELIRDELTRRVSSILENLEAEIAETVVPGRLVDQGVIVGEAAQDPIPLRDYIPRLLQALRDTHHGYELRAKWKRDILDSHTGHIPYSFPELVVIFTLALAADSGRALSGEWLSTDVIE
jgi:hypothetical protein